MEENKANVNANGGLLCYTPLTFSLIIARMSQCDVMKDFKLEVLPRMTLAQETLQDWIEQRPISLMTATPQYMRMDASVPIFKNRIPKVYQAPWLRMILLPNEIYRLRYEKVIFDQKSSFPNYWAVDIPQAHYIDNFDLHYGRNPNNSLCSVQVSFLLPKNHGLEETHSGIIVDLMRGSTVLFMGAISEMFQQDFQKPYPIPLACPSQNVPQGSYMKTLKCQESLNSFDVLIHVSAPGNPGSN